MKRHRQAQAAHAGDIFVCVPVVSACEHERGHVRLLRRPLLGAVLEVPAALKMRVIYI